MANVFNLSATHCQSIAVMESTRLMVHHSHVVECFYSRKSWLRSSIITELSVPEGVHIVSQPVPAHLSCWPGWASLAWHSMAQHDRFTQQFILGLQRFEVSNTSVNGLLGNVAL